MRNVPHADTDAHALARTLCIKICAYVTEACACFVESRAIAAVSIEYCDPLWASLPPRSDRGRTTCRARTHTQVPALGVVRAVLRALAMAGF